LNAFPCTVLLKHARELSCVENTEIILKETQTVLIYNLLSNIQKNNKACF